MDDLKRILEKLQSTSGKLAKQSIIKSNLNNELFVTTMKFILNDFIVTGLSTKKIDKKLSNIESSKQLHSLEEMMDYLKENNTGKDGDIKVIQNFLDNYTDDMKDLIKSIATKSIKLGVSADTWNKLCKTEDKLPVFDCMLAQKFFDNEDFVIGKEFTITVKRDGNRAIVLKENGKIKVYTRQGQLYTGLVDLENELSNLDTDNIAIDGELMIINDNEVSSDIQFKETMKIVRKDGEKHGVKLVVFDYMPLDDFKNGICKIPYVDRRSSLENVFSNCKFFEPVEKLYSGKDISMIYKTLDDVTSLGGEGVMVNINNASYESKRVKTLLKVKKMQSADLKIVGFEEGEGRLSGTLGRLNVKYKGNIVGVGSGFSDSDRDYIWSNKDSLLGKIVEVKYFEESTNQKDDSISLRFPVFKGIRDDKTEPSYY